MHLDSVVNEYKSLHNRKAEIKVTYQQSDVSVRCDKAQLDQVLNNLIENGLRYSFKNIATYSLEINLIIDDLTQRPSIEIIDNGEGINADVAKHLFEPFFTSEHNGSGLGLYIARELCEANQLTLSYMKSADNRTCFKLLFPFPKKEQ
jgi:two-component system sensor histidine kinase PilS (NtrC family)